MKNKMLLTIIFATTISVGRAQFNAGLRLGVNFCQIDGDQMSGYNLAGIVGGMFVSYPFGKKWEGQFEMLFSQKGSQRLLDSASLAAPAGRWNELLINYIEVPVMVNYKLSKKIKFSAGIGGALMISNVYQSLSTPVMTSITFRNVNWLTKGELSGTVGVQYFFTSRFSAFCRFTYSLLGINKIGGAGAFYVYDGGLANNVISFGAYYAFLMANK